MRKLWTPLLCVLLLCPRAAAEEAPRYLALTFDACAGDTTDLLEGLEKRQLSATFYFAEGSVTSVDITAEEILAGGHELALGCCGGREPGTLSRRSIAEEISAARSVLPMRCPIRFLRPPEGWEGPVLKQVARATGFAILGSTRKPPSHPLAGKGFLETIQDGDVVDLSGWSAEAALNTVDILSRRGFAFATVSQLARLRDQRIVSGEWYRQFPASS